LLALSIPTFKTAKVEKVILLLQHVAAVTVLIDNVTVKPADKACFELSHCAGR